MRKILITAAILFTGSCLFAQNDDDAIKKVLQTEADAYLSRNIEPIKANWRQDATAISTFVGPYSYSHTRTWDSISSQLEKEFKNPRSEFSQVKYDGYNFRYYGNTALVDYDMLVTPKNADPNVFPYTGLTRLHNYQFLVKDNDQWKTTARIVTMPTLNSTYPDHAAEASINDAGYSLIAAKKINEAIEVFKLNVKLYPKSWNTFDSLGEAYAIAGNKKLAIENYEKSIQLNPKSESGLTALKKLKEK